jgi:hypothetical protein
MPTAEQHHLRQFLLLAFALLIPCFAIWGFFSAALIAPVIGLVNLLLSSWFPDIINVVYQQGADAVVITQLDQVDGKLVRVDTIDESLGFKVNSRSASYSIPFYAALYFATDKKDYLAGFFWGLLTLYPFILLGVICICLKDLMVILGTPFFDQPGVMVPGPDVIGIFYQLSVLIVPTLLPVIIWAWQSRDTPLLKGLGLGS